MTITSKHVDPQGSVHLWDLGPTKVRMAAVDARHAIESDPQRWVPVDPDSPDKYEPAVTAEPQPMTTGERSASEYGGEGAVDRQSEPEHTGATGPAWYPPSDERSESEKGSG